MVSEAALFSLFLLACPIGMGLMMWMMMRGSGEQSPAPSKQQSDEITRLRADVDQVRAAQRDQRKSADRSP